MAQRHRYVLSRKIQNDLISKHNGYKGGDLAIPIIPNTITQQATEQPAPPPSPSTPTVQAPKPLPETVEDWQNMSNDDLLKLTPKDISNLSDESFTEAFTSILPLANSIMNPILTGPNKLFMKKAIDTRKFNMALWVSPTDPLLKTQLQGIPIFWLQHPNKYSHSKSQIILYNTYQDFQDTGFYKKYNSRIKTITPPRKFARYMNSGIPGNERNSMGAASSIVYLDGVISQYEQKWRIIIIQGDLSGQMVSGNDYYVYYIDCTDLSDYLDMLEEFYNARDTIQPTEIISMLGTRYRMILNQKIGLISKQSYDSGYSSGYSTGTIDQKAKDDAEAAAKEEAAKEASDNSSPSIWGTIGSVAMDVLPFLL